MGMINNCSNNEDLKPKYIAATSDTDSRELSFSDCNCMDYRSYLISRDLEEKFING